MRGLGLKAWVLGLTSRGQLGRGVLEVTRMVREGAEREPEELSGTTSIEDAHTTPKRVKCAQILKVKAVDRCSKLSEKCDVCLLVYHLLVPVESAVPKGSL